ESTAPSSSIGAAAEKVRRPEHPIDPLFLRRWSPRAMTGEPISDAEILTLFEAARWAPSTYNEQEWRFIYARRDTSHWNRLFDLLVEGNKAWCAKAALLCVIVAHKRSEERRVGKERRRTGVPNGEEAEMRVVQDRR